MVIIIAIIIIRRRKGQLNSRKAFLKSKKFIMFFVLHTINMLVWRGRK